MSCGEETCGKSCMDTCCGRTAGKTILFLWVIASIFVISYFSVKINNDLHINNSYESYNFNINVVNYDVVSNTNQYSGFLSFSQFNCSIYIYSDSSKEKVNTYLQYWYPENSNLEIYYTLVNNYIQQYGKCLLSTPMNTFNDTGMVVGFCIELCLLFCMTCLMNDPFFINTLRSGCFIIKEKLGEKKEMKTITNKEVIEMVSFHPDV